MAKPKTVKRRDPKTIADQAAKIWEHLRKEGPARAEALSAKFAMTAEALAAPLRHLAKHKRLKVAGSTRATTYTAAGRPL